MHIYAYTRRIHIDAIIKTSEDFFKKIYFSLYLKGLCVRGIWRLNKDCNILTPTLMAISISFPLSRAAQPEAQGPTPLDAGFLYHILSPAGLVSKLTRGSQGPLLLGSGVLNHNLSPISLVSKLTDFLSSPSYIIVQSPTQYLWNGMFDRHQAEITVMQFTGHSLLVHQSMTVPWDFTSSHIVSQARLRNFFP